jgi:hypothetical protein
VATHFKFVNDALDSVETVAAVETGDVKKDWILPGTNGRRGQWVGPLLLELPTVRRKGGMIKEE